MCWEHGRRLSEIFTLATMSLTVPQAVLRRKAPLFAIGTRVAFHMASTWFHANAKGTASAVFWSRLAVPFKFQRRRAESDVS